MFRIVFTVLLLFIPFLSLGINIKGYVQDKDTRQPIANALIKVSAQPHISVFTDSLGAFQLDPDFNSKQLLLIVKAAGYKTDTVQFKNTDKNLITIYLKSSLYELKDVAIIHKSIERINAENPLTISTITERELLQQSSNNLVDALVHLSPGISALSTGPNISKPFIHGLGYNRVLTLYDDVRQEGQQYGDEHGLEIDPYNVAKVEIIKGPASLLYGSDALAGVIKIYPNLIDRQDKTWQGLSQSEYHHNNQLLGQSISINYGSPNYALVLSGAAKQAQNYHNAIDGPVYLSNFWERHFSALQYFKGKNHLGSLNFTLFQNQQGIPDGSRDSISRKFTKQVNEASDDNIKQRPIVSTNELNAYKIPDLAQYIQHYRVIFKEEIKTINQDKLNLLLALQQNQRTEHTHPKYKDIPGMSMRLNTLNYSVNYTHNFSEHAHYIMGINGMLQNNLNKKASDFPIPNYKLFEIGAFMNSQIKIQKMYWSAGIRIDQRNVSWDNFYTTYDSTLQMDLVTKNPIAQSQLLYGAYAKSFQGISGGIGMSWEINKHLFLKTNIGKAYRAPNLTELSSNGLDPGAHIIYLGNKNFKPEFSFQKDIGLLFKNKQWNIELALFHNQINHYIYMAALLDAQGNLKLDPQGNRTYQYQQAKALLYGVDFKFVYAPVQLPNLCFEQSISTVYGFNKAPIYKNKGVNGEYLPLIPPMQMRSQISYTWKNFFHKDLSIKPYISWEHAATQDRYLALNSTETLSPAYSLWHCGIAATYQYKDSKAIQLIFQVHNLLDKVYQSHTNRLKYFEYYTHSPNNHYGIYAMGRNMSLKLILPF